MSAAAIDPLAVDRALAGCGASPMNVATLGDGSGWRFTCFVGPATARAGGDREAADRVRGLGLRVDFHWADERARAAGFGRCYYDVAR